MCPFAHSSFKTDDVDVDDVDDNDDLTDGVVAPGREVRLQAEGPGS